MDRGAIETISGLLVIGGGFILFIVKLSLYIAGTLQGNTAAIKTLTDYLEKQDKRNDGQDEVLKEHGDIIAKHSEELSVIKTIHTVKGCI